MSSIETLGLGAGSYPEPEINEEKCYIFNCDCSCKTSIAIYAKDQETAEEELNNMQWFPEEVVANNDISVVINDLQIEWVNNTTTE